MPSSVHYMIIVAIGRMAFADPPEWAPEREREKLRRVIRELIAPTCRTSYTATYTLSVAVGRFGRRPAGPGDEPGGG
jgi:hypothetical protein